MTLHNQLYFEEFYLAMLVREIFSRSSLFLKVLFSFKHLLNGIQKEFFILPLLNPFLGSGTFPSNLSLLLASIILNF